MSISKESIKEALETETAINKALQADKVRSMKNKFTPHAKEQIALCEASKRRTTTNPI